jgi:hypothetical protein
LIRVLVSGVLWTSALLSVVDARMWRMAGGRALRRIGDPVVAATPGGVRIRTWLHPTAEEAEALSAIGELLGSLYRGELAGRIGCGVMDREGHALWRAQRKQALTAVSSSRWAGTITRAVEDQYQLGMRGLAAHVADLRAAVEVLEQRCALRPGELAPVDSGEQNSRGRSQHRRRGYRSAGERFAKTRRLAVLRTRLARAGGVGRGSGVDHGGWETVVAQPQPSRHRRDDRTAMAKCVGCGAAVCDR